MFLTSSRWRFDRRISMVIGAMALALGALAAPGATTHAQNPPGSQPDFTNFAGPWIRHGFGITVGTNGDALARWRVYSWCDATAPPGPCDSILNGQGSVGGQVVDLIENGGLAQIVFTGASSGTASGMVIESTVPDFLVPGGLVTLSLLPYDMAVLVQGETSITLCGPSFGELAPPDVFASSPCGA